MEPAINVIYKNHNVLVIDKPAGVVVHAGTAQNSETLANWLIKKYPQIKNVGENKLRPGIVHRLDKDTSGVMVVAKTNQAFNFIKKQFQQKKVLKKYLALVNGQPPQKEGTVSTYLSRDRKDKTKQKVSLLPISKGKIRRAITQYKIKEKFDKYTLLEVWPKTGRMHQIRAHLCWLGCPVAGDKKYTKKHTICPPGLKRQFLHAAYLALELPNGQFREFESPLSKELKNVLEGLQKR